MSTCGVSLISDADATAWRCFWDVASVCSLERLQSDNEMLQKCLDDIQSRLYLVRVREAFPDLLSEAGQKIPRSRKHRCLLLITCIDASVSGARCFIGHQMAERHYKNCALQESNTDLSLSVEIKILLKCIWAFRPRITRFSGVRLNTHTLPNQTLML